MTETSTPASAPKIAYMVSKDRVSLVVNSQWRTFHLKSQQGQELVTLLKTEPQDVERIAELADIITWIAKQTNGRVTVDECDRLYLDKKPIDYGLSGRIAKVVEQGQSFEALARFIENVSENPDPSVAEDLYRFMEVGNLPLTEDGYVLVFKKVDKDGWSFASGANGKVQYLPGTVVEMPREDCDPNRQRTCSRGLHGCSHEYLNFWYRNQGRVMIGRIHPRDVTAIPADHNDQKLRCCRMEVVGEIDEADAANHFNSVVDKRYPPKTEYPAWEQSDEGRLAGGPAVTDDGAMGWIDSDAGKVWGVTVPAAEEPAAPADAVNDGPLQFTAPDDSAPEADPHQIGFDEGYQFGRVDRANGYDFDATIQKLPGNLTGAAITDYRNGYAEGYTKGHAEDADETLADADGEGRWTLARALQAGKRAGILEADAAFETRSYNNDPGESDAWGELIDWITDTVPDLDETRPIDHDLVKAFERAFRDAYHTRYNSKDDAV